VAVIFGEGDAEISGSERRGIVQAVAHHHHRPGYFELTDEARLLFGARMKAQVGTALPKIAAKRSRSAALSPDIKERLYSAFQTADSRFEILPQLVAHLKAAQAALTASAPDDAAEFSGWQVGDYDAFSSEPCR
jgi:hypothetical protein